MSEPSPPNNWDDLISSLGVTPPTEEEKPAAHPTPAKKPASRPPHPEKPASPQASDWDLLASELGVAPVSSPPPPPPPPAAREKKFERPPAREEHRKPPPAREEHRKPPPAREEHRRPPTAQEKAQEPVAAQPPPLPETAEESPNFFDERFDFSEPFDVLENGESSAVAAEPGEPGESAEQRPRRRRRRRGRGRPRDSESREGRAESSEGREPAASKERSDEPDAPDREPKGAESDLDVLDETVGAESRVDGSEADETGERRPKRRRGRRRKKRPGSEDAQHSTGVAGESDADEDRGPRPAETLEGGYLDAVAAEGLEDEEEVDTDGRAVRVGFRGIPTWEEAVGMLVAKNLESRAKRPGGGGSPRGRGPRNNRGPRDNRGQGGQRRS